MDNVVYTLACDGSNQKTVHCEADHGVVVCQQLTSTGHALLPEKRAYGYTMDNSG